MTDNPCTATIRGLRNFPDITQVNVRRGPGTNYDIAFKAPVGMDSLSILKVSADNEGKNLNSKVYQWFNLEFHGGAVGWIRDDLLAIEGNCGSYGYGIQPADTFAFAVTRGTVTPVAEPKPVEKETTTMKPAAAQQSRPYDEARIQKAALAITSAFEGSGYDAFNNYDAGVISYGIIQFTLAAGTLATIINNYLGRSNSQIAQQIRAFQARIQAMDQSLRNDPNLKNLLIQAAREPEMQLVQDELAIANYWSRTLENYVKPRGYRHPLTHALLFDISVNFGVGDGFVRMAERDLGIPTRSNPQDYGKTEEQVIERVAQLRKISHDKQALRDNLPGLRARGDFWVDLVGRPDWDLIGDTDGFVIVSGRRLQVATF